MTKKERAWLELPLRIAVVHWTDSSAHGQDTVDRNDPGLGCSEGVSVGVVVQDTPDHVTLAMDYWDTGHFRGTQSISRRAINRIRYHKL